MEGLRQPVTMLDMWANTIPMDLVWDRIEQDADALFQALAQANAQRMRQWDAAQRRLKQDLNLAAWRPSFGVPPIFVNGDAAQAYRAQLSQALTQAQACLTGFETRFRATMASGPTQTGPVPAAYNQIALIALYVAQCHRNLEACRQAMCGPSNNRSVPKAWQQWAAVAAIIELVTAVVALTARAMPAVLAPVVAPTILCASRWHVAGDSRASVRSPLLC